MIILTLALSAVRNAYTAVTAGSQNTLPQVPLFPLHGRQIKTGDLKCPSEHTQYIPEVQMALPSHPHHSLTASLLPVPRLTVQVSFDYLHLSFQN